MKEWRSRLLAERRELMRKYEKLSHFLVTADLPKEQMVLLARQKDAMYEYLSILDERIELTIKGK